MYNQSYYLCTLLLGRLLYLPCNPDLHHFWCILLKSVDIYIVWQRPEQPSSSHLDVCHYICH